MTLGLIQQEASACTRCSLSQSRTKVVFADGDVKAPVMVIGEAPGYWEDQSGLPFVGKAGVLLDQMLESIGLSRKINCYIANILKCRPPDNRNPEPSEIQECSGFLKSQIDLLGPKFIIPTGKFSTSWLINGGFFVDDGFKVSNHVGKKYEYKGIPFIPIFHPAYLLRNEEKKEVAWENLKTIYGELEKLNIL